MCQSAEEKKRAQLVQDSQQETIVYDRVRYTIKM